GAQGRHGAEREVEHGQGRREPGVAHAVGRGRGRGMRHDVAEARLVVRHQGAPRVHRPTLRPCAADVTISSSPGRGGEEFLTSPGPHARAILTLVTVVTFDVGETGCRGALWRDGARVHEADGPGPSGLADDGGAQAAVRCLAAVWQDLAGAPGGAGTPDVVVAGLAGLLSAPDRADEVRAGLAAG